MAESILPSRSRRMRGLLFPYRFSSVVNSFFCMCMGKGKQGGNRAKGETEKGWRAKVKTLVGIESLHMERIGERNGRTACRILIATWFCGGHRNILYERFQCCCVFNIFRGAEGVI